MQRPFPKDLDRKSVNRVLQAARGEKRVDTRIDLISAQLLGRPYRSQPLIGSATAPEEFSARIDSFDCVTFIETVFALACSARVDEFADMLRRIRYASGDIAWTSRNHYMTDWIRQNMRSGRLRRVPALKGSVTMNRVVNVVAGLDARRTRFSCVPKAELLKSAAKICSGDLIFFASTRKHLDVFHCGILANNGRGLRVRHASRSRGAVLEQSLAEFLKQNRMAGVIVVRPAEAS